MSIYLNKPIAYLEDDDFDAQGNLVNNKIPKDIPVVIMFQASWCPHCTNAKPVFQEFAKQYDGRVFVATIQSDGERESEKLLGKRATKFKKDFKGFPDYMLYIGGKPIDKQISGRDIESLKKFAGV